MVHLIFNLNFVIDLQACTRFSNLEFDVKKTNNPFWTPNGALPVAHYGSRDITDFDDLQALLKFKVNIFKI